MTYGPLWALISGMLVLISGGNVLVAAIFFKLLLVSSWIGSLWLIWRMLSEYSPFRQCVALAIFGWLPFSVIEIASEGHNDILMVFLLLLWLFLLERGRTTEATLALAASALVKYITAPLFLAEILYLLYSHRLSLKRLFLLVITSGILMVLVFGVFFHSWDFFASTSSMRDWHFFTPQDAVVTFSQVVHLPLWLKFLPQLIFIAVFVYVTRNYMRFHTIENFRMLVLTIISTILFSFVGHVWPWFLSWVIPMAALMPESKLSRWNIGAALAFPFATLTLQFVHLSPFVRWGVTGLLVYIFALFWLLPLTRNWFGDKQSGLAEIKINDSPAVT